MALGKILRDAREAKGLSATDVAEQTNMMVQIVQELENEDFHRIAAPIYGRGFLKLYAELVGVDAKPLIDEFMDISTGKIIPELRKRALDVPEESEHPALKNVEEGIFLEPAERIPQRVEVAPAQARATLNAIPLGTLPKAEPVTDPIVTTTAELPVAKLQVIEVESTPMAEPESFTEEIPQSQGTAAKQAIPEVGGGLFDSDEPNLFNTSPLQERIAEARRMMDEKNSVEKDKKSVLHLGSNPTLPIFQIGGRMTEQTFDTELRNTKPKIEHKLSIGPLFNGFSRVVEQLADRLPFSLSKKSFYIYSLLGVIIVAFMVVGIVALFKLTAPAEIAGTQDIAAVEAVLEELAPPKPALAEDMIPSPPDMYFD